MKYCGFIVTKLDKVQVYQYIYNLFCICLKLSKRNSKHKFHKIYNVPWILELLSNLLALLQDSVAGILSGSKQVTKFLGKVTFFLKAISVWFQEINSVIKRTHTGMATSIL